MRFLNAKVAGRRPVSLGVRYHQHRGKTTGNSHMMDVDIRASYIDFVNRSFRDIADQDYLAARGLYRLKLGPQFLWSAQQAIEKYLKGYTALQRPQRLKHIGHNLEKAFQNINVITDIQFDFPQDVVEFIRYINEHGGNRYFEKPTYTLGKELLILDKTIWHIRRYCYYMRGQSTPGPDGQRIDLFPLEIAKISHSL